MLACIEVLWGQAMMSWRRLLRRGQSDAVLQQEIELHLAEEIAENIERGLPADEARRQAYLKFGNPRRVREDLWQQNSFATIDTFWRDMRQALRRLKRSPSVVVTVMVSLGLGIAANVFIFTAVNKLLLQGPPVGDPATLVNIYSIIDHSQLTGPSSLTTFDDLREHAKSFSGVAAYNNFLPATIAGPGDPERVWGQSASTNLFDVAELPMTLGRGFHRGEDRSPVIVLSYDLWRRHFGGDPAILGKPVSLSGKIFTVIGVAKPGFRGIHFLLNVEFWVPQGEREQLAADKVNNVDPHQVILLDVVARLKPGVSRTQAQAELDAMARQFAIAYPKEDEGLGFHIEQAGAMLPSARAHFATFLTALTVVALLVLCIAGSNVANLLLARAAARSREMAVRIALGATRFQLVRPMLLESTLMALSGGVFGVGLSLAGLRGLGAVHLPVAIPFDLSLTMGWHVMLHAFLLSVGTGMLCGVAPALAASRPVVPNSLKGESTLQRPGRRLSLRNILVVLQISLCLILLCTTGLFLRSLRKTAEADPGFQTRGVLIMSIDPVHNGYTAQQTPLLLKRIGERAAEVPGVTSVAWTDHVPLSFYGQTSEFHIAAREAHAGHDPSAEIYQVSSGYFETIGIPWVAGRDFNTVDPGAPKQAVVNHAFARKIFGASRTVGERVTSDNTTYEIVGVVKDAKSKTLSDEDEPIVYRSLEQNIGLAAPTFGFSLLVRYAGNAAESRTAVRNEIHALDPQLAIFNEKTIEAHLSDAMILPRVSAAMFGFFGLAGLLLAAVGLYGVMSYSVSSRTPEIGIRLALGATRGGVQRLIVRQGVLLSCIAMGIGLPLAWAASRVVAGVLYGIAPHDWITFTTVPAFLAAVTLLACWIPARRAATVEPQTALRHE
jgi:predicted permease